MTQDTVGWIERASAGFGLVLCSPALALSCIAIKASSPGPVLFRAERAGRTAAPFTMFKLRTMHQDSAVAGPITAGGDPRIFHVGRTLRMLKLDEVPQLINVLRGEMGFFGPRPESVDVVEKYYEPWMMESLEVPPGIVGPGSLGYYLEEDQLPSDPIEAEQYYARVLLPRKIARDLVYVRQPSFGYRFELLARTMLGIIGAPALLTSATEREERTAANILRSLSETPPLERRPGRG